ncbi:protein containing C-type lectin domain protein [Apostichopus japonicus]|uniref:Protein containing C-type lectin domain protein n=1 Tax=Stichopus japonicus TaxID=307972 RepID=A0A2G8JQD6_STIJA|nr:protein containing C-type lectin domain protein [Apostichopus japonicus]
MIWREVGIIHLLNFRYPTSYQKRIIPVKEFRARYVRIVPRKSEFRRICLQVELFGGEAHTCRRGYTALATGCYALIDNDGKYSKAVSKCSSKGGYVVEISTRRENAAVSELANGKDIWLGLSDSQGNQRFDNPMGSPALYSNFAMQEPNVMEPGWPNIYMRGSDSRWIRSAAKEDRFIICEIDGDAPSRVPEGNRLGAEFEREIPDSQFSSSSFRDMLFPESGRLFFPVTTVVGDPTHPMRTHTCKCSSTYRAW